MVKKPKLKKHGSIEVESTALVPIGDAPKNKPPVKAKKEAVEREVHKQAFAYYFSLGPTRTLALVAAKFGVKPQVLFQWSSRWKWGSRIRDLENRSNETLFKDRAMSLLLLLLNSFSKRDETGKEVLTSTEKVAVEKLKLAVDSFKRLRDDGREQSDHDLEGSGGQSGPKRFTPPFMVNVILKGLEGGTGEKCITGSTR